jgi:chromosome segregation ATPase
VVKSDLDSRDAAMNGKIEEVNAKINELNAILVQANTAIRNIEELKLEVAKVKEELTALSAIHAKDKEEVQRVAASMDRLSVRLDSLSDDTLRRLADLIQKALAEPKPASPAVSPQEAPVSAPVPASP